MAFKCYLYLFLFVTSLVTESVTFKLKRISLKKRNFLEGFLSNSSSFGQPRNHATQRRVQRVGFDVQGNEPVEQVQILNQLIGADEAEPCAFPYELPLIPEHDVRLFWQISPAEEKITFCVKGNIRRDAAFGLGFSEYGEVENADFLVMSTDDHGEHNLQVEMAVVQV